jgi:hypothetical protein
MKKETLRSILRRQAEETIPPAGVDLWPAVRERLSASNAHLPGAVQRQGQHRRANPMKAFSGFARSAAWIVLAAVLIALVSWSIRRLAPQPVTPAVSEETVVTARPPVDATPIPSAEATTPTALVPTPTPLPASSSGLLPGASLRLEAAFPEAPVEVNVYTQAIAQPLTAENARAMATQLGVLGHVYNAPSEGGGPVYTVHDGRRSVTFVDKPGYFLYSDTSILLDQNGAPPLEEQIAIAEAFLKEHGLADFPHNFETLDNNLGSLRVVPLLEDRPVRHGTFDGPQIDLRINRQGQVIQFSYAWPGADPAGLFPILSAAEAWQQVLDGKSRGISAAWLLNQPRTLQTWERIYPLAQRVELYGYVGRPLQPVEPGVDPLVTFANLPVQGEKLPAFLQAFQVADFVQIWGQVQEDAAGLRTFQLEGWQLSPYPDVNRSGAIRRQGEAVYLDSEGQSLLLPDVPAEVPDGVQVETRGVVVEGPQPAFDWSYIQTGVTGEWGNSILNNFAQLDLSAAPEPTGTPLPEGERPGDRVEGLEATVSIYPEGIGLLTLDQSRWFYVEAPYPEGMAQLNNLPVRVWGEAAEPVNDQPSIRIERYEEVYPGLRMQAWLGTWENAQIDGQAAMLFTAQDSTLEGVQPGTQYVIFSPPLTTGGPEVHGVGLPGRQVIYEGLLIPGQQFGGFPVIHIYSGAVEEVRTNLDGYEITMAEPFVSGEEGGSGLPQGEVVIDAIELAYITTETRGGPRDPNYPVYVEPAWRFVGHYADGTKLEILVQALREEYLD